MAWGVTGQARTAPVTGAAAGGGGGARRGWCRPPPPPPPPAPHPYPLILSLTLPDPSFLTRPPPPPPPPLHPPTPTPHSTPQSVRAQAVEFYGPDRATFLGPFTAPPSYLNGERGVRPEGLAFP